VSVLAKSMKKENYDTKKKCNLLEDIIFDYISVVVFLALFKMKNYVCVFFLFPFCYDGGKISS
jgi:hypothetical protein